MLYQVRHITRYAYREPVTTCHSELRLAPRVTPNQKVWKRTIAVRPSPERVDERMDYFGNHVHSFALFDSHAELEVTAESVVEVSPPAVGRAEEGPPWEQVRDKVRVARSGNSFDAIEFTSESPFVVGSPEIELYARESFTPGRGIISSAVDLTERIHRDYEYKPESTTIDTKPAEVFAARRGVCQDFAHLMLAMVRSLGLPARYVSGYLRSGANYTGAEASHAWVSIFVPGPGWFDLDPTNNAVPTEGHVTVAWGRDYGDVAPLKGVTLGGGEQKVEVDVRVAPEVNA
ncbi:MAG: transglutaminase family protein [Bryobacteraceae bacterium]